MPWKGQVHPDRVQVLPHGGQFHKDDLNYGDGEEQRRKEAAVEATLKRMKELAREAAVSSEAAGTVVKIKEAVSLIP